REVETCSLDLLRATRAAANELRLPIVTHAAYNIIEFYEILREHRMTPVELMERVGLLGPDLTIGHGNLIADNALLNYSGGRELALMGRHGVTVSHCPVNIARRARYLDSWQKYREAGVNLALGSDTYPRDLIMQMRMASYFGKVMSHNLFAASAGEVFAAATLGGARALGRDDLGRLAPGAKADIVVVDLTGGGTLRYGPVRDPIKSLVECGIGDDVETVVVDGVVRMRDRVIPRADMAALGREAPDGYTLAATVRSTVTILPATQPDITYKISDFAVVGSYVVDSQVILVKAGAPWKTLEDLIDHAKKNPGKLSYGSAGLGTNSFFTMELLKLTYGLDMTHVPFGGSGPVKNALLGGHVQVGAAALSPTLSVIRSGD